MLICKSLPAGNGGVVYSTDDFFMRNGLYQFQPEKLEKHRRKNILRVRDAMINGIKTVVVDDTNIFIKHMQQYAFHAVRYYYEIYVVEPETSWKYTVEECYRVEPPLEFLEKKHDAELRCLELRNLVL
uniref:NEDD4-binding protein 1-like n=1 Tax=Angiostrongylus cantonensis TaxID=6313 RepID=A0A0K0D6U4_ANGCA